MIEIQSFGTIRTPYSDMNTLLRPTHSWKEMAQWNCPHFTVLSLVLHLHSTEIILYLPPCLHSSHYSYLKNLSIEFPGAEWRQHTSTFLSFFLMTPKNTWHRFYCQRNNFHDFSCGEISKSLFDRMKFWMSHKYNNPFLIVYHVLHISKYHLPLMNTFGYSPFIK